MATIALVLAFIAIGVAVAFVAFSGGPSQAREAYLTKGRRGFRVIIPIIYIGLGIAVPALVLANNAPVEGASGSLASKQSTKEFREGKELFRNTCWSCHSLEAAGAQGVTGPSLDDIGPVDEKRILNAIRIGGTGDGRMPANLLSGACDLDEVEACHAPGEEPTDAELVARYIEKVAGR
jgi:mono/diheme cytochrome c family protein